MNFSNLASTSFGRGRASWPTSSTLPGTPHFSAFRDRGVPIKLPKFYDDDGLLWFKVAEAMFNFRGLSDDKRKCELLLSALDHMHFSILEFPLAHLGEHSYDELKSALLKVRLDWTRSNAKRRMATFVSGRLRHSRRLATFASGC